MQLHYLTDTYGTQWTEPFDPEDPVSQHPSTILTPHIAGASAGAIALPGAENSQVLMLSPSYAGVTEASYRGMAQIVAREALRMMEGLPPTVQLNRPAVPAHC